MHASLSKSLAHTAALHYHVAEKHATLPRRRRSLLTSVGGKTNDVSTHPVPYLVVPPWRSGYAVALYAKGCGFKSAHGYCRTVQKPSISPWLFGQCTLNIYPVFYTTPEESDFLASVAMAMVVKQGKADFRVLRTLCCTANKRQTS